MYRAILAMSMLAILTSTTYGSLYLWNPNKRLPLALPQALRRAEQLLGDDAKKRYCINVTLYGNRQGDGKECYWNLAYAATDGSIKHVYIDETGNGSVALVEKSIDWREDPPRRESLADIAKRINAVLEKYDYVERAIVKNKQIVLRARVRTYQVYPMTESGGFAEDLEQVVGPKHDGLIIEASAFAGVPRVAQSNFLQLGEYWQSHRARYLLTGEKRMVTVHIRYGGGLPDSMVLSIMKAFGESEPSIF